MKLNVLISSAGRRVGLTNCFRDSLSRLHSGGKVIAADATAYSAAAQAADESYLVPLCTDREFIPEILQICSRENIGLIVPTIDTELPVYAESRKRLREAGVLVAVSSPEAIAICYDKALTHGWLLSQGAPVPMQADLRSVLSQPENWAYPLIVKPTGGSGSQGVRVIHSRKELEALSVEPDRAIVQQYVEGREYTINVFVNSAGVCLCAVPHLRMEIRAGEVSKGVTVKSRELMSLAARLAEALPGAFGALNVQCFVTHDGDIRVIEVNARFGGGYPLTHRAGAPFTEWLVRETLGLTPMTAFDNWQEELTMLRYDEAIFVEKGVLEEKSHVRLSSFVG